LANQHWQIDLVEAERLTVGESLLRYLTNELKRVSNSFTEFLPSSSSEIRPESLNTGFSDLWPFGPVAFGDELSALESMLESVVLSRSLTKEDMSACC
jgi:hypothetical protein